jgi:hypothetical protein
MSALTMQVLKLTRVWRRRSSFAVWLSLWGLQAVHQGSHPDLPRLFGFLSKHYHHYHHHCWRMQYVAHRHRGHV